MQVLLACALTGIVQAVAGGQPLLIVGVAEPIVLIWGYLYHFAAGAPRSTAWPLCLAAFLSESYLQLQMLIWQRVSQCSARSSHVALRHHLPMPSLTG